MYQTAITTGVVWDYGAGHNTSFSCTSVVPAEVVCDTTITIDYTYTVDVGGGSVVATVTCAAPSGAVSVVGGGQYVFVVGPSTVRVTHVRTSSVTLTYPVGVSDDGPGGPYTVESLPAVMQQTYNVSTIECDGAATTAYMVSVSGPTASSFECGAGGNVSVGSVTGAVVVHPWDPTMVILLGAYEMMLFTLDVTDGTSSGCGAWRCDYMFDGVLAITTWYAGPPVAIPSFPDATVPYPTAPLLPPTWGVDAYGCVRDVVQSGTIGGVAMSGDGRVVVIGLSDGQAVAWRGDDGTTIGTYTVVGGSVESVAVSDDGQRAVSGWSTGDVVVWDTGAGGTERFRLSAPSPHTASVTAVAMTPNGGIVVTGSEDDSVRVWSGLTAALIFTMGPGGGDVHGVAVCDDGSKVLAATADGAVRVYDGTMGGVLVQTLSGHASNATSVAVDGVCDVAVSGGADEPYEGHVWRLDGDPSPVPLATLVFHTGAVYDVDVSDDGGVVETASVDTGVGVWQREGPGVDVWTHVQTLRGHGVDGVVGVAMRSDAYRVVSVGGDGRGPRCA